MRQEILQTIFINKKDVEKIKTNGLTITGPNGFSFQLVWDSPISGSRYATGNLSVPAKILEQLTKKSPLTANEIELLSGLSRHTIKNSVYKMAREGKIKRIGTNLWARAEVATKQEVVKNGKK